MLAVNTNKIYLYSIERHKETPPLHLRTRVQAKCIHFTLLSVLPAVVVIPGLLAG